MRIGSGAPVAVIDAAIVKLRQRVLHVVQVGLLKIWVVENVKCFRYKLQAITLPNRIKRAEC